MHPTASTEAIFGLIFGWMSQTPTGFIAQHKKQEQHTQPSMKVT